MILILPMLLIPFVAEQDGPSEQTPETSSRHET